MKRFLALGLTALALAGCTAAPTVTVTVTQPVPSAATTQSPVPGSPAATAPVPAATVTATPTPGTAAAAAWEALLGPDGEYASAAQYQAVIDAFGPVEPYVSIVGMEEMHSQALTRQLARFGFAVPANPYSGTVQAPATLKAAAEAWVEGEKRNVALYDRLLAAAAGDPGLTRVFTNLRRSSQEAHLPLFTAAAENGGQLTVQQMTDLGFAPH